MRLETTADVAALFKRTLHGYDPERGSEGLEAMLEAIDINPQAFMDYNMETVVALLSGQLDGRVVTIEEVLLRAASVACERSQTAFEAGYRLAEERRA